MAARGPPKNDRSGPFTSPSAPGRQDLLIVGTADAVENAQQLLARIVGIRAPDLFLGGVAARQQAYCVLRYGRIVAF